MEVEGSKTYANCVTIEDFMIQTNEKYMALMLTSFRYFSNITFLETSPDHPIWKLYTPPHISLFYYLHYLIFLHSTITVQQIHKSVEQQTNVPLSPIKK